MGKRNKRVAEKEKKEVWTPTEDQIRLLIAGLMNIPINGVTLANLTKVHEKIEEINKLRALLTDMLPKGK